MVRPRQAFIVWLKNVFTLPKIQLFHSLSHSPFGVEFFCNFHGLFGVYSQLPGRQFLQFLLGQIKAEHWLKWEKDTRIMKLTFFPAVLENNFSTHILYYDQMWSYRYSVHMVVAVWLFILTTVSKGNGLHLLLGLLVTEVTVAMGSWKWMKLYSRVNPFTCGFQAVLFKEFQNML